MKMQARVLLCVILCSPTQISAIRIRINTKQTDCTGAQAFTWPCADASKPLLLKKTPLFTDNIVKRTYERKFIKQFHAQTTAKHEIRPHADEMPITKYPNRLKSPARQLGNTVGPPRTLNVPGWMSSVPLYIANVQLLPKENSIVIFGLGHRLHAGFPTSMQAMSTELIQESTKEIANLDIVVPHLSDRDYELKCDVIEPRVVDNNCVGGHHILLCRFKGLDLEDVLYDLHQSNRDTISVQLNGEEVEVSTRSLTGLKHAEMPRRFSPRSASKTNLTVSIVWAVYGEMPSYLDETIRYLKASGISHLYVGVWSEQKPGSWRKALHPSIQDGFVSFQDLNSWPEIDFSEYSTTNTVFPLELLKSVINDWALYNAKNYDDLLLVSDYDELIVPTKPASIPDLIQDTLLLASPAQLHKYCFIKMCPFLTFGRKKQELYSRAADFPYMDGGDPQKKRQ